MKLSLFRKKTSPQDRFNEALARYQQAAQQNPGDIRIRVKIAELYLEHGQPDKAVEEYLVAARGYQEKRLFQIAVAIYNHAISINPDMLSVYTELANLHLRNGFVGDGVAVLEKLAHHYYEKGQRFEATKVLQKIREIDPNNEFFKIKVARFYQNKEITEEDTLREGPQDKWNLVDGQQQPEELTTAVGEGMFDLEAALGEEDITISISAVNTDGDEAPAEEEHMSPDEVFSQLKSMIDENPEQNSPQFHFNLALAYQRCSQYGEAIDEYRAAMQGGGNGVQCSLGIVECNIAMQRFAAAQEIIAEALSLPALGESDKLELIYQSGVVYRAMGDSENAMKVFKKIYAADRNFRSVGDHIKELSAH